MEIVILAVQTDNIVPQSLDDAYIYVYDTEDVFITSGVTGDSAPGEYSLTLDSEPDPGKEYIIRLSKNGVSFPDGSVQKIQVITDGNNIFDFTAHTRELPESLEPEMCRLSGVLADASLRPLKNAVIEFNLMSWFPHSLVSGLHYISTPAVVNNNIITRPSKAKTDSYGYIEIDLIRRALYNVFIHGCQYPDGVAEPVVIPTSAGAKLEDVLFPYVVSVAFGSGSVNVAVDATAEVSTYATASNEQLITLQAGLGILLVYASSNEDVALVELRDGKVQITGVASGAATVVVTRIADSNATRQPSVSALVVPTVTITVT